MECGAWFHGVLLRAQAGFGCANPVCICFAAVTQSDVASFTCRIVEGECIILSGYSSVRCFEFYGLTIAQLLQG